MYQDPGPKLEKISSIHENTTCLIYKDGITRMGNRLGYMLIFCCRAFWKRATNKVYILEISCRIFMSPLLSRATYTNYFGCLVVLRINVDLAIFQPYLDLEAGYNQPLKIEVVRPGIEPRLSCSASQEFNFSATAAPTNHFVRHLYVRPSTCFPIVKLTLFSHTLLSKLQPMI